MKIVINYADVRYRKAQHYNTKSAYKYGGADKVIEYSPDDIDKDFRKKYAYILNQERGGGYWLWKPYVIKKTLQEIKDGDYIFYVDSGSYFIESMDKLIEQMEKDHLWLMSYSLPFMEINYTKRDILETFGVWNDRNLLGKQRLATFILIKKTEKSMKFMDEYLQYATMDELITDAPSIHQPEDVRFIENRHDQSIYSLLCKKYNIPDYRDPSEYGIHPELYHLYDNWENDYQSLMSSEYPQIMVSHRKKNPNRLVRCEAWLRRNLPFFLYKKIKILEDKLLMAYRFIRIKKE